MANESYKYVNTFKVSSSIFELYKNDNGQFKTIKTVQGSYVPEEQFYDNQGELLKVFAGYVSKKELLG